VSKRLKHQWLTEPAIRRNKRERMAKLPKVVRNPGEFLFFGGSGHTMTFDDMEQVREWVKGKVKP
jgi:hypothetical protein